MQLLRFVLVSIDKISNFFWTYSTQRHKNSTFTSTITINKNSEATNTHTHTHLTALFQGLPGWVGTRKAKKQKTIWILLKQETVSDSDISWAIYKSAPRSRQITTPAPHHSVFTGRLPFLPPNQQRQSTEGKPQTQVDGKKT